MFWDATLIYVQKQLAVKVCAAPKIPFERAQQCFYFKQPVVIIRYSINFLL